MAGGMTTKIYVDPKPTTSPSRSPHYTARLHTPTGEILASSSHGVIFEAARILHTRGVTGRLEQWVDGEPNYRLCGEIERLRHLTMAEGSKTSLCFTRWHPFPPRGVDQG